jgi:hypothetical protein
VSVDVAAQRVTARSLAEREQALIRQITQLPERDPRRELLVDSLWQLRHTMRKPCPMCGHVPD